MFVSIFDENGRERDFDCGDLAVGTAYKLSLLPEVKQVYIYSKIPVTYDLGNGSTWETHELAGLTQVK